MLTKFVALIAMFVMAITPVIGEDEEPDLRIGVLPVLNTLPMWAADEENLFEAEGLSVELVPFSSPLDQRLAIQSGEIDGMNTDMVVAINLITGGTGAKAVLHDELDNTPFLAIVAGPETGISSSDDLIAALGADEAEIGIAANTIIEYLTTTMLRELGYEPEANDYAEFTNIPDRLENLIQGNVAAATLPEPLVNFASTIQGGSVIVDDTITGFMPVVSIFRQDVLDEKPEAVAAFLRAYETAVEEINANPDDYRETPIQVPEPIMGTYVIPPFPSPAVPTEEEVMGVVDWMVEEGLLEEPIAYEDIVDDAFLPDEATNAD